MAINRTLTISNAPTRTGSIETCVYSGAAAQLISRSSVADLPHVSGVEEHPSFSGIMRDSENLWPLSGEITCTYTWSEEDNTDVLASLSDWESLANRADTTISIDKDARQASLVINGDYNHSDWVSHPAKWIPKSATAVATAERSSKIVCITRRENPELWTCEYLCISEGSSKQITKEGTECFLFISGNATVGSTNITANEVVKMSSSSVTLSATDRCVVVRLYK